jgi:DNA-binding transcriptional MerR regulator
LHYRPISDVTEVLQRLRATGMPIRTIRRYAELVRAADGNELERLGLLREHPTAVRTRLAEIRLLNN